MNEQDLGQLTLYQEDFPASLFPWLESKKERGMTVTYGRKCSELSENLRRLGLLVRTYLASCELPDERFVRTWSVRDTLSPYLILKLRLSEQNTGGKECSLWVGTPEAANANHNVRSEKFRSKTLNPVEFVEMWPTPDTNNHRDGTKLRKEAHGRHAVSLHHAVAMWPTPTQRDYKGARKPETLAAAGRTETNSLPDAAMARNGGQLNPMWVEGLMGFPIGWSDISEGV